MSALVQTLVRILADGQYHSGTRLGDVLGISRAAVWKHIDKLSELDLEVHSVRGKGYRLAHPLDLLDETSINGELGGHTGRVQQLDILQTVDSSNAHVMRLLQEGGIKLQADKYAVCLAERQTSGKGRRGRSWASPFGRNLYLTLAREFDTAAMKTDGISLVVGMALIRALAALGISGIGIKWPNDLLWQDRKLAGILLEISGDITGICQLVIGIGVNVHCRPEDMSGVTQPWTDLQQVTGNATGRNVLAGAVIAHVMDALQEFEAGGLEAFMAEWQANDIMRDRQVELITPGGSRTGRACGISPSGALLLEDSNGVQAFNGGEISLRGVTAS